MREVDAWHVTLGFALGSWKWQASCLQLQLRRAQGRLGYHPSVEGKGGARKGGRSQRGVQKRRCVCVCVRENPRERVCCSERL